MSRLSVFDGRSGRFTTWTFERRHIASTIVLPYNASYNSPYTVTVYRLFILYDVSFLLSPLLTFRRKKVFLIHCNFSNFRIPGEVYVKLQRSMYRFSLIVDVRREGSNDN